MELTKALPNTVNLHILIVVQKPPKKTTGSSEPGVPKFSESDIWIRFCNKTGVPVLGDESSNLGTEIRNQRLADNVWLLALKNDFPLAAKIVQAAKEEGLPHKWTLLENEPTWNFQNAEPAS